MPFAIDDKLMSGSSLEAEMIKQSLVIKLFSKVALRFVLVSPSEENFVTGL